MGVSAEEGGGGGWEVEVTEADVVNGKINM